MNTSLAKNLATLLFIVISTIVSAQQEKYVVVSDYDDTFRITGYKTLPKVWNALYTDKIYAGSDILYQAFQKHSEALYFISNTPEMLRNKVTRRIKGYQLEPDSIFLFHGDGEKFDYKIASVKWILQQHPNQKLILLGDNATADHLVYDSIKSLYPKRVLQIYIRTVKHNNPIPKNIKHFYTAFEIAKSESEAQRITKEEAEDVGEAILKSEKKYVAPSVLKIPEKRPELTGTNKKLNQLQTQIFDLLWSWK